MRKDQARGFRLTRQRLAIREVLCHTDAHPDADWVHQQVRQKLPSISMGTVYRNLAQMAEAGIIRQVRCAEGASRWDGRTDRHCHVICSRCGRVADIELPNVLEELERAAARESGFRIVGQSLCLAGICPQCQTSRPETDPVG